MTYLKEQVIVVSLTLKFMHAYFFFMRSINNYTEFQVTLVVEGRGNYCYVHVTLITLILRNVFLFSFIRLRQTQYLYPTQESPGQERGGGGG